MQKYTLIKVKSRSAKMDSEKTLLCYISETRSMGYMMMMIMLYDDDRAIKEHHQATK